MLKIVCLALFIAAVSAGIPYKDCGKGKGKSTNSAISPRIICTVFTMTALPDHLDPTLCTDIHLYGFGLDATNNVIYDMFAEFNKDHDELYKSVIKLKIVNKGLKIAVDVSWVYGWAIGDLAQSPARRKKFIENSVNYLKEHSFDGMNLEYPGCWQSIGEGSTKLYRLYNCTKSPETDREIFGQLIKEMKGEFVKHNLSLSANMRTGYEYLDQLYNYTIAMSEFDHVNVGHYPYDDGYDPAAINQTAFVFTYKSSVEALEHFAKQGFAKEKLSMLVAFWGTEFFLANKSDHSVGAPIERTTAYAENYAEVCTMVKYNNWTKEYSEDGHDPFAYKDDMWISYGDPYMLFDKSKWIKDNGYGGVKVYAGIGDDDMSKQCCTVSQPLLKAINYGLTGKGDSPETYGCEHK